MLYFKKIVITDHTYNQVEASLRKVSSKRNSSLDMVSPYSDIGTDKYFLGREGKTALTFTRIKTSFEKVLPKLILELPYNTEVCYCQIRLSVISMVIFCSLSLLWALNFFVMVIGQTTFENFLVLSFFYLIYLGLLFLEIRLSTSKFYKAIKTNNPASVVR